MRCAWKTRDCLRAKKIVGPGFKALDKMERPCRVALFEPEAPSWSAEVPAVEVLRRVWVQKYQWSEGKLSWRSSENIPPAGLYFSSPYDLDAH